MAGNFRNNRAELRLTPGSGLGVLLALTLIAGGVTLVSPTQTAAAATAPTNAGGDFASSFEETDSSHFVASTAENDFASVGTKSLAMTTTLGAPGVGYNLTKNMGFSGKRALKYSGTEAPVSPATATTARNKIFENLAIAVGPKSRLSYVVLPDFYQGTDLQADTFQSTYVALDLHFTDGTYLSQLNPGDQNGAPLTARGQGDGKMLYLKQWNAVRSDIGVVANGKTIDRIVASFDNPNAQNGRSFSGWIDDLQITAQPKVLSANVTSALVDTRRGTNASFEFSRGNNLPITAVPNGFTFLTPVTDASSNSWQYSYQGANNSNGFPELQGVAVSHEPSPWMGDRDQLSLMSSTTTEVTADQKARAVQFSHADEIAQPDLYQVSLANNTKIAMTASDHGGVFKFTFPAGAPAANVIFDSVTDNFRFYFNDTGGVSGWVENGPSEYGTTRMFVSGVFSQKPTFTGTAPGGHGEAKVATFATSASQETTVTLQLGTSFIGTDQAAKNLNAELIFADPFAGVQAQAAAAWKTRLGVISVEGATDSQRSTLYSSLYRLNLYPNSQFENTGTAKAPTYQYASPVGAQSASTETKTGAKIVSGKIYVNNGFWDTYRTVWPAYSLLYPKVAADLVDGFVQLYRDGGWIPRWSSPGYANMMTGTSSDMAFADAYLRGVALKDPLATYEAAVKNATVVSSNPSVGRKGLDTSQFLGYPSKDLLESVSWGMENPINDQAIAAMGAKLAADRSISMSDARRSQMKEESAFFADQAKGYANLFNTKSNFFEQRGADGSFADSLNPMAWGSPYTEGNGWSYAFTVPQDGQGLTNLYGGRDKLSAKLDAFFATPETALSENAHEYGGVIHEMLEAQAVRMGQLQIGNQPVHHVPYMYNYVGKPWMTAEKVREVLKRQFVGGEIGQGFAGDDDNGEMSSWFILSSLGIYPLQTGSANWAIGSPLFTSASVTPLGGTGTLRIQAPGNSSKNIYVQSLKVNGVTHASASLTQSDLAGNSLVEFTMGATKSAWATGANDAPPSPTVGTQLPATSKDIATADTLRTQDGAEISALSDNNSGTSAALPAVLRWTSSQGGAKRVARYTLTSAAGSATADPTAWSLWGSNDGDTYTKLDSRAAQSFTYRQQTRPFTVATPSAYSRYELRFDADSVNGMTTKVLSEVQLFVAADRDMAVGSASPVFVSRTLPNGVVGTPYSTTILTTAPAGSVETTYATTSALPNGLSLSADGVLSGTPTTMQKSDPIAITANSYFADNSFTSASVEFTDLWMNSAPVITSLSLPAGMADSFYSYTLEVMASDADPVTFSIVSGTLPFGLFLNSSTGKISGFPAIEQTNTVTFQAQNSVGISATWVSTISIAAQSPTVRIVSKPPPNGRVGVPYSFTVTAVGSGVAFSASNLPNGLALDAVSGVISGTPTLVQRSYVEITAANSATSDTQLSVVQTMDLPLMTVGSVHNGTAGSSYDALVEASGGDLNYRVISGTLPEGIRLIQKSGMIRGTPTKNQTSSFQIEARNEVGADSRSFSIVIEIGFPKITSKPLTNALQNSNYSKFVAASGSGTMTYALASGQLPQGLALNTVSGEITGLASTIDTQSFTVVATNEKGTSRGQVSAVMISALPVIAAESMPTALVGVAYRFQIPVSGGGASTVKKTVGTLPAGLKLRDGWIVGTPTKVQLKNCVFTAKNWVGTSAAQSFAIRVIEPAAVPNIAITATVGPRAITGKKYSFPIKTSGGGIMHFSVTGGTLPGGLTLSGEGVIAGVPENSAAESTFVATIRAENSAGSDEKSLTIMVRGVGVVTNMQLQGIAGKPFSMQLATTGQVTGFKKNGGFPAWLTLSVDGVLSGTAPSAQTVTPTIKTVNDFGKSNTKLTITFADAPATANP